jgi:putative transposase
LFLLYQANVKETIDPDAGADDASCLLERVASVPNLARALLKVARNMGAAGVDGQRVGEVVEMSPDLLPRIRQALIDGTYLPGDIRRVWIPKSGGGERGLGIPNVVDRVVQQAVHQLVQPIFEPTFHNSSHGLPQFVPGGTYFFTVVTDARRPIPTTDAGRELLRNAINLVRKRHPFTLVATVLLPNHWHLVMQLPSGDDRYSLRMKQIKAEFSDQWLAAGFPEATVKEPQRLRGERGIRQPRFWEHTVRDEDDLERCADYIHWNPRKHQVVDRVADWPWSWFHRFVRLGQYDINWGGVAPECAEEDDWGEPAS